MPKLLVIDDEPAIQKMIESHFTLRGFQVVMAGDGTEGLEMLESELPDVVLLDLKMKKMDGDRFLKAVREKELKTKILVVTGYQDEGLRKKVEALGVDAFLEKPVSILVLENKIQEVLGQAP